MPQYFPDYVDALDGTEVSLVSAVRPADPGLDQLPFNLIEDRRFEILTYRLKCAQFGVGASVLLMQGVAERGRDVIVFVGGKLREVIQCKRLAERMTAPAVRRELLKLAFHAFLAPAVIGNGPIKYELWCPGSLTEPAAEIVATWPLSWTEVALEADAKEVLGEYTKFSTINWNSAKQYVIEKFPAIVQPTKLDNVDITPRVRACIPVYKAFFGGSVVMDSHDVEETLKRVLSEHGGYRELSDNDAKHILDRVYSFPSDKRMVFTSGYVLGVSPGLVSQFKRAEFEEFATYAIQATSGIIKVLLKACSRIASDTARTFREQTSPANKSITHVFAKMLTMSLIARVTGMMHPGILNSSLVNYSALSVRDRLLTHVRETWDEYQGCLRGYDPGRHAFASDEEFRNRIALHGLDGATTPEEFGASLALAIDVHLPQMQERFDQFMSLVPTQLLVITDTVSVFENKWLLSRMADTIELLQKLRGSEIIPE